MTALDIQTPAIITPPPLVVPPPSGLVARPGLIDPTDHDNYFGYARVSTDDQRLDAQIDALHQAGVPYDHIYQEHVSGAKTKRPELAHLLRAVRRGDVLVIQRLDRLGRSTIELLKIADQLQAKGVDLRSLHDHLDTTSPAGRLIFTVMAAFAEFERNLISERTKAGLKAARARGARGGRPPAMLINEVESAIKFLENPTVTTDEVAHLYHVSPSTLRRSIRRHEDPDKLNEWRKAESSIRRLRKAGQRKRTVH